MGDVRICSTVGYFPDDVEAACDKCGRPVFIRPHGPMDIKFLCLACGLMSLAGEGETVELKVPEESLREIQDLIAVHINKIKFTKE